MKIKPILYSLLTSAVLALPASAQIVELYFPDEPVLSVIASSALIPGIYSVINTFQDSGLPFAHAVNATYVEGNGTSTAHAQMNLTADSSHFFGGSETYVHLLGDPGFLSGGFTANFGAHFRVTEPVAFTLTVSTIFTDGVIELFRLYPSNQPEIADFGTTPSNRSFPASGTVTGTFLPNVGYNLFCHSQSEGGGDIGGATSFDLQVSPLPEPSSAMLLAGTSLALLLRRRK